MQSFIYRLAVASLATISYIYIYVYHCKKLSPQPLPNNFFMSQTYDSKAIANIKVIIIIKLKLCKDGILFYFNFMAHAACQSWKPTHHRHMYTLN